MNSKSGERVKKSSGSRSGCQRRPAKAAMASVYANQQLRPDPPDGPDIRAVVQPVLADRGGHGPDLADQTLNHDMHVAGFCDVTNLVAPDGRHTSHCPHVTVATTPQPTNVTDLQNARKIKSGERHAYPGRSEVH